MAASGSLKFTLPIAVVTSLLMGALGSYWSFASESKVDRAELRARVVATEMRLDKLEKCSIEVAEVLKRIEVSLATIGTKLDAHMSTARLSGLTPALPRANGNSSLTGAKSAGGS